MACDSTEQLRAEYGPFHTRAEAEAEARKLGFGYLLRYEHVLDENEEIQEVRCIFRNRRGRLERLWRRCLPSASTPVSGAHAAKSATHDHAWQAEVWSTSTSLSTPAIACAFLNMHAAPA